MMSPPPPSGPPPSPGGTFTLMSMPSGTQPSTGYTATLQPSCAAATFAVSATAATATPILRIQPMGTTHGIWGAACADPQFLAETANGVLGLQLMSRNPRLFHP